MSSVGTDIDNRTTWILDHQGKRCTGHSQYPEDISLEHGFPIFVLPFGHSVPSMSAACVIDKNVEDTWRCRRLTGLLRNPAHEFLDTGGFCNIQIKKKGLRWTPLSGLPGCPF